MCAESGWERDVDVHKGWYLCLCGGGGRSCGGVIVGGGVDCGDGGDGVMLVVLMVVVGIEVTVACGGVVGIVAMLCIGVLEVDCVPVVEILVLGAVFVVEVVELVVRCVVGHVVRLVLWCVNGRGYFWRCFSLKSVEMKGLSVGGFLFGMVIWADVLLDVMVVVGFLIFFRRGCLGDMMDVSVVMELVVRVVVLVGVMVLVWWRCSVVWQCVRETEKGVCRVVEEVLVWLMVELMVDELGGGIVAGSPMGFSESPGKTSHIVSHSCSMSLISFRSKLACKEEVV